MAFSAIKRVLRDIAFFAVKGGGRVFGTLSGIASAPKIAKSPQQVAGTRKSYPRRLADNLWWAIRHGVRERYYNQYGLDLVGSKPREYLDIRKFRYTRDTMNHPSLFGQCPILDDKRLFATFMEKVGFPVPRTPAVLVIDDTNRRCLTLGLDRPVDSHSLTFPLLVKEVAGHDGIGLFYAQTAGDLDELPLPPGCYVLQEPIVQAPEMQALGPSVNTLRIGTYLVNGERGCFGKRFI